MHFLVRSIRRLVYVASGLIALIIFFNITAAVSSPDIQAIRLAENYAFCAVIFLYLALLASPLYTVFPSLPSRVVHVRARQALGISAFGFALLHVYFAFFKLLGGFPGLAYLNQTYLWAITLSASALLILSVLALTTLRYFKNRLGNDWKILHRFIYLAGVLIVIHALILGSHFSNLSQTIPQISLFLLLILLILEAWRFDKYYQKKFSIAPQFGLVFAILLVGLTLLASLYLIPHGNSTNSLGIHAQHLQQSQQLK